MNFSNFRNTTSFQISTLIFLVFAHICCGFNDLPQHWPSNGTVIKNTKWEVPFSDSLKVLSKEGDLWRIPSHPEGTVAETTYTSHRKPQLLKYNEILGRVDQEVVHSNDTGVVEFYRFEKGTVLFLGYTNSDSLKSLTEITPPLLIQPENIMDIEKDIQSTGVSRKWNKEFLDEGFKTTFLISKKESGRFITANNREQKAILCEMIITQEAPLSYGETNLMLPNAITIKSNVLLIKDIGAILEWGIRERKIETENEKKENSERKLYVEITRYINETK